MTYTSNTFNMLHSMYAYMMPYASSTSLTHAIYTQKLKIYLNFKTQNQFSKN